MRKFLQRQAEIIRTTEFGLAFAAALLALGAGGDMFVVAIALSFALFVAFLGFAASKLSSWLKVLRATGAVFIVLLLESGILFWHFHGSKVDAPQTAAASSPTPSGNKNDESRQPLSMRQLFDSDFVGLAKIAMQSDVNLPNGSFIFAYTQYFDLPTNSFFLAFFVGRTDVVFLNVVSCRVENIIKQLGDSYFKLTRPGDTRIITTDEATFSKQIFLYLDDNLSIKEMARIEGMFAARGYTVSFRTTDYKITHWREWDRIAKGAEKGTNIVLPSPEAGMAITAENRYSPARDWFKGPPTECPLPPEQPNRL
jgi:hypothetical protein